MRDVEGNQVGQRAHVRVRERGEVVRDLHFELEQQRSELVVSVVEYVSGIDVHNSRPKALHDVQGVLRKRHCLFVPRNAAAEVAVIEITCVAADHRAVQRAAFEKLRVIAYRRLEHTQQNCKIGYAAGHRPSRVLLMTDWDNSILRDKPKCGFNPTMFSTADGPVIEPSVSVPTATEHKFAAAPAPEPEL